MKGARASLLWRITSLHVLAILVLCVVLPLAVRVVLNATTADFQRETLQRHEAEIARSLHPGPNGLRLDLSSDVSTLYEHAYAGFGFAVTDGHGRTLFSSTPAPPFQRAHRGGVPTFRTERRGKAEFDVGDFPERIGGRTYWIQVSQDLSNSDVVVDDVVSEFLSRVAWLIVPVLALLLIADFITVRRALRPVVEASDLARGVTPTTLSVRLPAGRLPTEIAPLAHAVNEALDRLQRAFQAQREFTADAAHELRTPLSIQRVRLDALPEGRIKQELIADTDRMTRIVNQLLQAAELENFVLDQAERADLHAVAVEVVEFLAPVALKQGRRLALLGAEAPLWVNGDPQLLFGAIRNLVENALAHTRSGTTVKVRLEPDGLVKVMDRGEGIAPAERELVFRRFWRRDRSREGGAGLGLSIVARIAAVHRGQAWMEPRAGGGSVFCLRLNRASAPEPVEAGRQALTA